MYLAHELLHYFNDGYEDGRSLRPYSMMDFIEDNRHLGPHVYKNVKYCKRLEQEGLLDHMGNSGTHPYYKSHYYTNKGHYQTDISKYGGYDLLVEGFLAVRERFSPVVLPLSLVKPDGDLSVGSCFVYKPGVVITARHCIEKLDKVSLLANDGSIIEVNEVYFSANENLDIAVLLIDDRPFSEIEMHCTTPKPEGIGPREMDALNFLNEPSIVLFAPGQVLDEILTMGYPPITGFEAIQIADKTAINSTLFRTSKGEILAEERKYMDGIEYILINAKVKGGNSGGPIFDKLGRIIGMVVEIPTDFKNHLEIDKLGYGLALPSMYMKEMLDGIKANDQSVVKMKVTKFDDKAFTVN
ncbi:serine protease Do [Chitinophaga ginsengisegetis]|uniref:Serine protease Do n=1 Tax=Chitinophaga ginsengisegetis TaxID=393003 RepID=A0A1T5P796_9BACT|nr:serine protease [Chitinophaga ginsengisegetis]SKD08423.1 serine protease Do [Chitinophaga ginsengisegetis]